MKNIVYLIFFCLLIIVLAILLNNITLTKKIEFIRKELPQLFVLEKPETYLFLGKMGYGYQGGENTDSIFVVYLKRNKAYIIHIPRDLIVRVDNNLYKINSLYALGKKRELLAEVSNLTGFNVQKYVVFDIHIIKKIVDILGGLEVDLKYPVTDALTGYTLPAGKRKLNSEWIEFVLRSRYYPQGDFTRMENQFIIIKSLKERLKNISFNEYLKLTNLILQSKRNIETNLNYREIFNLADKLKKSQFIDIILDFNTNLWLSDYFEIKVDDENFFYINGLIPKDGIGQYEQIRTKIQEKITEAFKKTY
jgi:LCP family protein required for cell wall assembly